MLSRGLSNVYNNNKTVDSAENVDARNNSARTDVSKAANAVRSGLQRRRAAAAEVLGGGTS